MGGPCFKGGRFKHGIFSWDSNGIRYKSNNKYKGVYFAPRKKDKSPPAYHFIRIEHLKCFQHWLLSSWPVPNGQVELKIVEPIFRLFVNGIAPGQGEVGVSDLYGFYMVLNQLWPNPRSMINDRSDRCMDRMDIYWVITQLDLRKTSSCVLGCEAQPNAVSIGSQGIQWAIFLLSARSIHVCTSTDMHCACCSHMPVSMHIKSVNFKIGGHCHDIAMTLPWHCHGVIHSSEIHQWSAAIDGVTWRA